jgi:hypothetical protein
VEPRKEERRIKITIMRWVKHVARIRVLRDINNISVRKSEGKRRSGRPRRRWEDNSRMDLREIGWEDVDWIHLAQDRDQWWAFVNTVMNFRVL